ncbi:hypothetical protein [Piscibacillus salipiscarius]|uniref:WYL domain-containing protein n=1 Tax=Piscibacillus salipiscarius TaxID=299480 RepID=A0ABW5QEG8_9BACI|nr:hypothetical protein [Piscibacillus salipiscarius]
MERILQRALEQKQQLEMIYLDQNGDYSQRIVRVVKIYEDDFLAFCFTKQGVRRFKKIHVLSILPYKKGKRFKA